MGVFPKMRGLILENGSFFENAGFFVDKWKFFFDNGSSNFKIEVFI